MTYTIEDFLEIKAASAAGFSPDGRTVLVSSNLTGTAQLYTVPVTGGDLTQITDEPEPVAGGFLPQGGRIVLQIDVGGNERTQLFTADAAGGDRRVIASDPEFIHRFGAATRDGSVVAFDSNRRNGVDFDVYVHDLASGEERPVFEMGGWCNAGTFTPDGSGLIVSRATERNADNDLYLVHLATGDVEHLTPHDGSAMFGRPAFLPDGSAFFCASDLGTDLVHVARYDGRAKRFSRVIEDAHDLEPMIDLAGRTLLVAANEDGITRFTAFDPLSLVERGPVPLARAGVAGARFSRDGSTLALSLTSSSGPGDVWISDLATSRRLTSSPSRVPEDVFVEPTLHRFESFDGESIPVFLYEPAATDGPVPVVCYIHGGPESQFTPAFNPMIQYLVYRGYAVAAPNVRGSTGYGKRFHHLDDVEKRLDSVADLASMHDWLAGLDGVDHRRAALMGGSYGGYMTLAGLAFQPERWAAGVDIVGISSLVSFLENTSAYRRAVREREYGSLERDRAMLEHASPLTHVDRMRAPLMIIHGANDPRVPLSEAEQIHAVLRTKGVPSELLVYHDEGHGLAKLKNRIDAYPKVIDFLDRHLKR